MSSGRGSARGERQDLTSTAMANNWPENDASSFGSGRWRAHRSTSSGPRLFPPPWHRGLLLVVVLSFYTSQFVSFLFFQISTLRRDRGSGNFCCSALNRDRGSGIFC